MTNDVRRANDLRQAHLRETGEPIVAWRLIDDAEKERWLRKVRDQSVGVTVIATPVKRSGFTPASVSQRQRIAGEPCIVLDEDNPCAGPIDPAHVIDRALGGDDDPRIVVPLCRRHHGLYDNQELSILEYWEPRYRDALAYAVVLGGLVSTLQQVTGQRWVPDTTGARIPKDEPSDA